MTPRSLPATQLVATQAEEPAAAGLCRAEKAAPVTCAECGGRLEPQPPPVSTVRPEPLAHTGPVATQGEGLASDSGSCSAARIAAMHCPTCIRRAVILTVVARSVVGAGSDRHANASPEQSVPRP